MNTLKVYIKEGKINVPHFLICVTVYMCSAVIFYHVTYDVGFCKMGANILHMDYHETTGYI